MTIEEARMGERCESCDHIMGAHGPYGCEYEVDQWRPGQCRTCGCAVSVDLTLGG